MLIMDIELMLQTVSKVWPLTEKEHIIDTNFLLKILLKQSLYNILKNVMFHSQICKKKTLYVIKST